jgi:hypothetical protein
VVYVRNTKPHLSKLEDRGCCMVFIGYDQGTKGYKVYDPVKKQVHISRDVVFDESTQWDWTKEEGVDAGGSGEFSVEYMVLSTRSRAVEAEETEQLMSPPAGGLGSPPHSNEEDDEEPGAESPRLADCLDADHDDAPLRLRSMESIVGQAAVPGPAVRNVLQEQLHVVSAEEPSSLAEAEQDPHWKATMMEEIGAIEENDAWTLTDLPADRRAVELKWIFKLKRDEQGSIVKHKARMVVKGYSQQHGIDYEEVYALVARLEAARMLLALATQQSWEVHHIDVKSAFLNGALLEEVYVLQPSGFVVTGREDKVLKLKKAFEKPSG